MRQGIQDQRFAASHRAAEQDPLPRAWTRVAEIYISRSIDCGSNLPPTVFRCDTMRDIKRLYDEINHTLNKPDLEPVFDRYMPLTGVSLPRRSALPQDDLSDQKFCA